MRCKTIALVGYESRYFLRFGEALSADGFKVLWVVSLHSDADRLERNGVPPEHILDTTVAARNQASIEDCEQHLSRLETAGQLCIRDIIMMDRMLRRLPYSFAVRYLSGVARLVDEFFERHDVALISSGRDTALQMISMLVAHAQNRLFVVPTRARLPRNRFGFTHGPHLEPLIPLRSPTDSDRTSARAFLQEFRKNHLKPDLRSSARNIADVIGRLPLHSRLFLRALIDAWPDRGNRFSRYTIPDIVRMYFRRRWNMLRLAVASPFDAPAARPYCLYALHTQPESSIDVSGSVFSDQLALIAQIARAIPVTHDLYVKAHPSDMDGKPAGFYRRIQAIPGVRLIDPREDSRALIGNAAVVFTVTGTIALEAGLLGVPAVTFAPLFFNAMPTVRYAPNPATLAEVVGELLARGPMPESVLDSAIESFLTSLLASTVPGEVHRLTEPLTPDDHSALCRVYTQLIEADE